MKVVLVNKYATVTGGADRHAIDLAGLLAAHGHGVRFLSSLPPEGFPFGGEYIEAPVTHATRAAIGRARAIKVAATLMWNQEAATAMKRLIEKERPDVVHIHKAYPQLSVAPAVIASARDVPIVQTAHDYEFISASAENDGGGKLDRSSPRLADRAVNTASFALRRRLHVPRVTSWIVASSFVQQAYARNGIDAQVVPLFVPRLEGRSTAGFEDRSGIVFLGRLVMTKGVGDVVEVARRRPEVTVTIAGSGELEQDVRHHAATLPNLQFVGNLESVRLQQLLAKARVALMPSRWAEPAGMVALEAMAEGTPVVAYSCGGLADYVASSGGGILVDEGNVNRLADAAARLHSDRELWMQLSTKGEAGVRRRHDPTGYVQRLEAIYSDASRCRHA
jgi:glycosyltransferase involved in cell wall biosynthesis